MNFKFSCEKFPHINQNKKYLSDLVDKLLDEAKVSLKLCDLICMIYISQIHLFFLERR